MADGTGAIPKRTVPKKSSAKVRNDAPFQRSGKTIRTPPKNTEPADQANQSVYLCQLCSIEDDVEKVRCDKCFLWFHFACANISKEVIHQPLWLCGKCAPTVSSIMSGNAQTNQPAEPLITLVVDNPSNVSRLPPQPDQVLETTQTETVNPTNVSGLPPQADQVLETTQSEPVNPSNVSRLPPQADQVLETTQNVERKSKKARTASSTMSRRATLALQRLEEERQMNEVREEEALAKRRQRDQEYLRQKYSILEDDVVSIISVDDQEVGFQQFSAIRQWADNIPPHTNNSNPFLTENEMQPTEPQLNSTAVVPQVASNAVMSSANQTVAMLAVDPKAVPNVVISSTSQSIASSAGGPQTIPNSDIGSTNPSVTASTTLPLWLSDPKTLPLWLTNPKTAETQQQMSITNRHAGKTSDQTVVGGQNVGSNAHNVSLNTIHQSLAGTTCQPNFQMNTVGPTSQISQHSSDLNSYAVGMTSSQIPTKQILQNPFGTIVTSLGRRAYQLVYSNQQMGTSSPQQVNASQPQFLGTNQPQPGPSEPQVLGTSQTFDNKMFDHGQGQHNKRLPYGDSHVNSGENCQQSAPACSTYIQTPNLGYNQPQRLNYDQSITASQAQQSNQDPTTLSASQTFSNGQQLCTNVPVHTSQYTSAEQSRSQLFGNGGHNTQYQSSATSQQDSQSQPFSFGQQTTDNQRNNISQSFGIGSSIRNGPTIPSISSTAGHQAMNYNHSDLISHSQTQSSNGFFQSFGHSQRNNLSQSFGIGSSIGIVPTIPSISSTAGQPQMSNNNFIPISQPSLWNNSNVGLGGINQSFSNASQMAQTATPGRLTAEQIASRHVMPKELPFFYGDATTWLAFISAYENATAECGLSNSENLARLQRCLKGDAHELVKTRLVHKDSVPGVIETLRMVFGRPELIIEKMVQDIQRMPPPKEDDLSSLIKFAIAIQNLSTTIQDLRAVDHLKNPMLINSVVDKLPTQHRLNWAFYKRTIGDTHIGHLGDWLYQIADAASQVVRVINKPSAKKPEHKDNKNKPDSSTSNLFLNTQVEKKGSDEAKNNSYSNNKKSCPACNSNKCATIDKCEKFKEASRTERWSIVKIGNICGRCLGPHKFYRCQSSIKCSVDGCHASHHTLLHNHEVPLSEDGVASNSNQEASEPKTPPTTESEAKTCNSQRSKSSERTDKFRIVPVMLHNKNKSVRDYAYLDDGSNMTTIEESLAQELELVGSSKELCVEWALGQTHSTKDSRSVSMKISGYYDNAPRFQMTNVRTVPDLHLPLQSISSSWIDHYPHFKNVPIATYENIKPRLLIGLQYSRLMVSQQTIEGSENEPIVCRTRLGWVVQGPTYELDATSTERQFSNNSACQSNETEPKEVVPDRDGRIRHAMVKIGNPVSKLASLDVRDRNDEEMVKLTQQRSVNGGKNVANHPVCGSADRNDSSTVLPAKDDVWSDEEVKA